MSIEWFQQTQKKLQKAIGAKAVLTGQLNSVQNDIEVLTPRLKGIEEAQVLLQLTAQETQDELRYHFMDIVQSGLDTVFPDMYECVLDFNISRGKTEADIYLVTEEGHRVDPLEDNGGGLSDIVSFSLRMACWALSRTRPIIILDEPFKFVSKDVRPQAAELLKTISKKLGLQILMVTHDDDFLAIADKNFLVKKDKRSEIAKITPS